MRTPIVPERFVVLMEGKPFVLYAGLLHVAQEQGIGELSVSILQIPSTENNHTAIVSAKVVTGDGSIFVDIGDASPESISDGKFTPHLLRVASTRAKSRALRDAYGITMTSIDELAMERIPQTSNHDQYPDHVKTRISSNQNELATDKQMMVLHSLALQLDFNNEDIAKLDSLTKQQASQAITELSNRARLQKGAS